MLLTIAILPTLFLLYIHDKLSISGYLKSDKGTHILKSRPKKQSNHFAFHFQDKHFFFA